MENVTSHVLLHCLIFIPLCDRTCMQQDQVHSTKVFIKFVVFQCKMHTLLFNLLCVFCNCVDHFFSDLHVHKCMVFNEIVMAAIADEIATVKGLPMNNVSVHCF